MSEILISLKIKELFFIMVAPIVSVLYIKYPI
jgi:hypothetical protein